MRSATPSIAPLPAATQPMDSEDSDPIDILHRLSDSLSQAQSALLAGNLTDLATCLACQLTLCCKLQPLMRKESEQHSSQGGALVAAAKCAQQRARIFTGVLRRMRQTLTAFQRAMQNQATYELPPITAAITRGR